MIDLAIATSSDYPDLGPYDKGVVADLVELGIRAKPLIWSDPDSALDSVQAVLIQSTWDSHLDPVNFLAWARRVQARMPLFNSYSLLEWNLDKRYLRTLEQRGIPVTPTLWVDTAGGPVDLRREMHARGWERFVIKPAISAGANETHVCDTSVMAEAQATLNRLRTQSTLLVQPYLTAFETEGERSYVFFDGVFSHAIGRPPTLKSAQRSFEEAYVMDPVAAELQLSKLLLTKLEETPLYARVDVATNNDGVARLQELELIEPSLFTSIAPGAQRRYAEAIARRVRRKD